MNAISYTNARANLARTMEQVCENHAPVLITRANSEATVLISLEDYESIIETNYLLQSPANALRLKAAIEEVEAMIAKKIKRRAKTKK